MPGTIEIFDVDQQTLRQILDQDPYYRTAGVQVLSVRAWNPIVGPTVA